MDTPGSEARQRNQVLEGNVKNKKGLQQTTMSGLCREIITLQLGHYSNFVGTHWWNLQVGYVIYFHRGIAGQWTQTVTM